MELRGCEGDGGGVITFLFLGFFHVLEQLDHFQTIKKIPDNRLGS